VELTLAAAVVKASVMDPSLLMGEIGELGD
jgi:hypothetical protein